MRKRVWVVTRGTCIAIGVLAGALVCGWTGRGGSAGNIALRALEGGCLGVPLGLLAWWKQEFWTRPRR